MEDMVHETPIGFAMAMALNAKARDRFAELSYEQRKELETAAGNVHSKREMEELVREIAEGSMPGQAGPAGER